MTLREWMQINGHSVIWLAEQVQVTRNAVYGWLDGNRTPRWKHMMRLERLSGGQLTINAFRPADVGEDPHG